jgi:hypothetical protein
VAELLPKIPSALHAASPPRSILDPLHCFLAGPAAMDCMPTVSLPGRNMT